ncbi:MAG: hypothetical protein MJZ07_03375 [Bacteroidales bacterium]|nr:hypothetical protein [Bacteroidales bacterium]
MNRLSFSKLFSALLLILPGCRDINFDLADVDLSVTVGGEFALPVGSLQEIKLGDILGLDGAGNAISTDKNGDYHIALDGRTASPEHRFGPSSISMPLNQKILGERIEVQLPNFTSHLKYTTEPQQMEQSVAFSFASDGISELVRDVRHIAVDCDFTVTVIFHESGLSSVDAFIKAGSRITFPEYLEISIEENAFCKISKDGHALEFLQDMETPRGGRSLNLHLSGMDLSKAPEGQGFKDHRICFDDEIGMDLIYYFKTDDLTDKGLAFAQFEIDFQAGRATIGSVEAITALDPDIKEVEVDLSAAQGFMGEGGIMDLDDIILLLEISNDSPVSGNVCADIKAIKDGLEASAVTLGRDKPLHIDAHSTTRFCISEKGREKEGCVSLAIPRLTSLLRNLPDRLWIGNYAIESDSEWISFAPEQTYGISIMYSIDAPVAFGSDLQLETEQQMDLDLDLGDKVQFNTLDMEIEVDNTTPLNFVMDAQPLGEDGKALEGVDVECEAFIKAGLMVDPESSRMVIHMEFNGPQQKISGLDLKLNASTDPEHRGIALNKDQGLKMKNIVAHVRDGITIDLNRR